MVDQASVHFAVPAQYAGVDNEESTPLEIISKQSKEFLSPRRLMSKLDDGDQDGGGFKTTVLKSIPESPQEERKEGGLQWNTDQNSSGLSLKERPRMLIRKSEELPNTTSYSVSEEDNFTPPTKASSSRISSSTIGLSTSNSRITMRRRRDVPSLAKAIFSLQSGFGFFESRSSLFDRILRNALELSESGFGFISLCREEWTFNNIDTIRDITTPDKENKEIERKLKCVLIMNSLMESSSDGNDNEFHVLNKPALLAEIDQEINKPTTLFGAAGATLQTFIFNEITNKSQSPIWDMMPTIYNFIGIPLFMSTPQNFDRPLLGVLGLANHEGPFTSELTSTVLQPFVKVCEILIESYDSFRALFLNKELRSLISKFKDSTTGIPVKDRRHYVRLYEQCFTGKEAINWFIAHGKTLEISTREDALALGNKLMSLNIFHHVVGGSSADMQDETSTLYSFSDNAEKIDEISINQEDQSQPSSSKVPIRRSRSILGHFGGDTTPTNPDKKYQLHSLVERKDIHTIKKKLTKRKVIEQLDSLNDNQQTALHLAIEKNESALVEMLLQAYTAHLNKVNIHIKDKNGYTPLHCASEIGNTKILMALLQYPGIQTNITNNTKNTPFHCFCNRFSSPTSLRQIFELFLTRGTLINVVNKSGETPLHKAVLNPSVRLLMVRLLLENGPDVNIANDKGETALHYAIHLRRKDLVAALLSYGADPNLKPRGHKSAFEIAIEEKHQEILILLNKTQDLIEWLSSINMKQYLPLFVKEMMFKDVLHFANEKTLIDLGITWAGDRLRILSAIQKLKQEMEQQEGRTVIPRVKLAELKQRAANPKSNLPTPIHEEPEKPHLTKIYKEMQVGEVKWIQYKDLEFTELLGSGTSGDVYRGYYMGEEVAVKVLEKERENRLDEFKHEFKIMNSIRGPYIVRFYGACLEPKPCLVMEYCSRGSLYGILNDKKIDFSWKEVLLFASEMTNAINVLHHNKPQILHRDLKSMNFLVTKDWTIKVCDFGLSRFFTGSNMSTLYELRGTMIYCAPETFQGKHFTTKGDIYSLGILFWEMAYRCLTGEYQRPFAEYSFLTQPLQIIVQTAQKGLRPTFPNVEHIPHIFIDLVKRCWDPNPANRPDTDEIILELDKCTTMYEANPAEWNVSLTNQGNLNSSGSSYVSTTELETSDSFDVRTV